MLTLHNKMEWLKGRIDICWKLLDPLCSLLMCQNNSGRSCTHSNLSHQHNAFQSSKLQNSQPSPFTSLSTHQKSPDQIHPTPKQITNHELLTYSRRKKLGKEIEHTIPPAYDQDSKPSPDSAPIYSGMETSDCEKTASVINYSNILIALKKGCYIMHKSSHQQIYFI